MVGPEDRKPPSGFARQVERLIAEGRKADAIRYFMADGMGAPSFVVTMMRMMPGVWSKLMAVAHTLPYDAKLLDRYLEGRPLPADKWSGISVPTLVLEGTESPPGLRHAAQALARALPGAKLVAKKGLGHTKKLDAGPIAAELESFFGED